VRLGAYEIEGELGRGGMGVVLRARSQSGEPVAVKLLTARGRVAPERFAREVRLLASLGTVEGFVPLLDSGQSPNGPFLVMPLLTGGTLRARIERGLRVEDAVAICARVARALGRAHAQGIVHRDLKPENVLFTAEDRPLVADLGLAKHFGDSTTSGASVSLSRTGEMHGTVGYMAPEQMNDAKSVGPPADVFALGAILFECLSGQPAFAGETGLEVMGKILSGERRALASTEAPRAVAAVVKRALALSPEDRFPDAETLARALEEAAVARPASRRAPVVLAALALFVVAIVVTVLLVANRATPQPPPTSPAPPPAATPPPVPAVPRAKLRETAVLGADVGCHDDIVWGVGVTDRGEPISVGSDGRLRTWDPATGAERSRLGPVGEPLQGVALGAGGAFAVTVGKDGTVHRFDLVSRAAPKVLRALGDSAHAIAISPDGTLVAAGSDHGTLTVIELETGASRSQAVAQSIASVAFLPDGDVLVAGTPGIRQCHLEGGAPATAQTILAAPQRRIVVSPDGHLAASAGADDSIRVFDFVRHKQVMTLRPHSAQLTAIAFSRDGRWLATGASDGRVALLRPTSEEIVTLAQVHGAAVHDLAFTESGRLVSGSFDRSVRLHDVTDGALRPVWPVPRSSGPVFALARAPNGQILAGAQDSSIRVWDGARSAPRFLIGHHWAIRALATSADGRLIGSSAHDRSSRLWRAADGAPLHELVGVHGNNVLCAALTPDGRRFLSGGDDGKIVVWDTADGRELLRYAHGPPSWCVGLQVRPDGRRFLSSDSSGLVQEWDLESGQELGRLQANAKDGRLPIALDKRGTRLVTGSDDKTARVWDVERTLSSTTRSLARFEVGAEIEKVAFVGGPDRVLCADAGGTVSLWDADTSRRLDEVKLGSPLWSLDVAPDGRTAWVGDQVGFVHELAIEDRR
jgi:WD40 repeat protein